MHLLRATLLEVCQDRSLAVQAFAQRLGGGSGSSKSLLDPVGYLLPQHIGHVPQAPSLLCARQQARKRKASWNYPLPPTCSTRLGKARPEPLELNGPWSWAGSPALAWTGSAALSSVVGQQVATIYRSTTVSLDDCANHASGQGWNSNLTSLHQISTDLHHKFLEQQNRVGRRAAK